MSNLIQAIAKADRKLFLTVNQIQSMKLNRVIRYLTQLGSLFFQSILIIGLMIFPATREVGYKLAIIQIAVVVVVQVIKAAVARVRPYNAISGITPFKIEKDYSFPSGHTAASFATAVVISAFFPAIGIYCFGLAILIGYSRIYIGVHYPLDVIAGSLIGLLMSTGIFWLIP